MKNDAIQSKILLALTLITSMVSSCAYAFTIDVQNNSDGAIQIVPDIQVIEQTLRSVNVNNPFAAAIYNTIAQKALDRINEAFQGAMTTYASGGSGSTILDSCPPALIVKKVSGTGAGFQMPFKPQNCDRIKLEINNAPYGFTIQFQ